MILLAIESATDTVGAAVVRDGDGSAERIRPGGRAHAEQLAPAITEVCASTAVAVTDVDAISVDIGPGLFTGLRVGVATAKALAQALGIGVLGVGSLDILAAAAAEWCGDHSSSPLVAVVDARRGEVFAAAYHLEQSSGPGDPAGVREDRPGPMTPAALEDWLVDLSAPRHRVTVVGDGALRYRERLSAHRSLDLGLADELSSPPPLAQAHLARFRLADGASLGDPVELVPDYRREADARINWEQRLPPAPAPGAGDRTR